MPRKLYVESGFMNNDGMDRMDGGKSKFKQASKIFDKIAKTVKPVAKPIFKALTERAVREIEGSGRKKRVGRFIKGSQEAKDHMARIRAMKK